MVIYSHRTMILLYNINFPNVEPEVTPIVLNQMLELFHSADRIIVY
jgi:hypothetical protein